MKRLGEGVFEGRVYDIRVKESFLENEKERKRECVCVCLCGSRCI